MLGLGIASGLNAGMRDIEGRRRQEMLDAERQEDRGMRREQFDMQMGEMRRGQDMREQRGLLAQGAMENQPYTGGDVNDPEFGLQAQADMGGMGDGLGLLSGLKTNEKQLNTGKYLSDMERHYAEAGDVEQAMKMRQAAEGIRKEGGVEAVKRLIAGDIQGAERAWNTTGSERIQPGSIKVDGDNVSWVNSQGKQVEMPLPALMDLVGIKRPEQSADWEIRSLGDGRYVQFNKRTGETRQHDGAGAGGPGSGFSGRLSQKDVEAMAYQRVAKGMGLDSQNFMDLTEQTHKDLARMSAEVVDEYQKAPHLGVNAAHDRVINDRRIQAGGQQGQSQPGQSKQVFAQAWEAHQKGIPMEQLTAKMEQMGIDPTPFIDAIQGGQQGSPEQLARQPGLLERYGTGMSNPVDSIPRTPQLAASPGSSPGKQRKQQDTQDEFAQLSSEGLLDKPSPELFEWISSNIDSLTGKQKQQAQQYLNRNRAILQHQGRSGGFGMNPIVRN